MVKAAAQLIAGMWHEHTWTVSWLGNMLTYGRTIPVHVLDKCISQMCSSTCYSLGKAAPRHGDWFNLEW